MPSHCDIYDQLESLSERILLIQREYGRRHALRERAGWNTFFQKDLQDVHRNIQLVFEDWEAWVVAMRIETMNAHTPHGLAQGAEGANRTPAEEAARAPAPHGSRDRA